MDLSNKKLFSEWRRLSGVSDTSMFTIYCDMDGVLADFEEGVKKYTNNFIDNWQDLPNRFFLEIEKTPDADRLMIYLKNNFKNIFILSAGPKKHRGPISDYAVVDKKQWMKTKFGFDPNKVIVGTKELKYVYAAGNKYNVLIDDTLKNIDSWNSNGGTGIFYVSAEACIRRLSDLVEQSQ